MKNNLRKILLGTLAVLSAVTAAWGYVYSSHQSVWTPPSISMWILMGAGTTNSSTVQAAMQTWNGQLGTVQFVPHIDEPAAQIDYVNDLYFDSTIEGEAFGEGVLAVTLIYTSPSVFEIFETDIIFNTAYTWETYTGSLRYDETDKLVPDLSRVAMHELGHVLGLDHPDEFGQSVTALMNSTISSTVSGLEADDITGAQGLYRAPGQTYGPGNDNFAGAAVISLANGSTQASGSSLYATKESGEPNHATNAGGASVWWRWTAPANGDMTITTQGSKYDTTLGIYTGSAVSSLTEVGSNDDLTQGTARYSSVTFAAASGTTYQIAVDGWNGASGPVTLNLNFTPAPVDIPPGITSHPVNQSVSAAQGAQFTVSASGDPAPSYQWQRLPAGSSTWSNLSVNGNYAGVYSATLVIVGTTVAMNGDQFRCVATNRAGSATSNAATLTVNAVVIPILSVSCGNWHSLILRADGSLLAVGDNNYGQLGDGSFTARNSPVPIASGVAAISAGRYHSLFLKTDATLWAMGKNDRNQLGVITNSVYNYTPQQVATGVAKVAAGAEHTMFIKIDGTLWAMGGNDAGQLGDGTTTRRNTPVQVATGVAQVAAGAAHTMFIKTDGTLWAMGLGGLGDGTTTNRLNPVQIASGVSAVGTGAGFTLFVKTNGTLWAVGNNGYGQLGDGTTTYRATPVPVASGVAAVSTGSGQYHSFFVKTDGTLWAMGVNNMGQLGDGTTTDRLTPVQVAASVASVAAGDVFTLFVKTDGALWAMGSNGSGQCATGSASNPITSPVQVMGPLTSAPGMVNQPGNTTVALASNVSFAVNVSGNPTPSYQWQRLSVGSGIWNDLSNGGVYSGVTTATLTITGAVLSMSGDQFRCVAINPYGSVTSIAATLAVFTPPPVITSQPANQAAVAGTSITLGVGVTSPVAVTYQWQKDGVVLPGATSATYDIASFQAGDVGSYTVIVTNSAGSVTSAAATLVIALPPVITGDPAAQTVIAGAPAVFSVTVTSNAPLSYEWRKNGTPISGATDATYNIASAQAADAADYSVVVSNVAGSDTSAAATLTVQLPPTITQHPANQSVLAGSAATFTVAASSTTSLSYQWQRLPAGGGTWSDITNGADNAGMQTASLTAGNLLLAHNGDQFRCVVSNVAGEVTSNAATLTVAEPAVVAAAAGATHSFAMQANGLLLGFGGNSAGELGTGDTVQQNTPRPYERVLGFATSWNHSLFIKADGTLWGMGGNANGQLGDGTTTARLSPTQVPGATDVALVATGLAHSLFIKADGTLWGMGGGAGGRLGDGTGLDRSSAIPIATGVVAVTGGVNYTSYVRTDGSLWTMGNNGNGQLGDGTTAGKLSPVHVADNVATVAAHGYHLLILKQDGTLWSTGMNLYGQLGDGTTTNRSTPFQIASGVAAVSSGTYHTLYVKTDGTLWAAGYNASGQLGNGTTVNQSSPVQVATGVAAVAGGNDFSLFIKTDGSLWGMGSNAAGQLIGGAAPAMRRRCSCGAGCHSRRKHRPA